MAYTSRSWSSGEVVEAADANRWEQGIAGAHDGVDGALTDAKAYTDQEVATRAPTDHDHTRTDISDSTALGRALMAVVDAGAGRDTLGITVDTSVGTRVMVGDVMIHGDTGWRNITPTDWGENITSGGLSIRRVGAEVFLRLSLVAFVAGTGPASYKMDNALPLGFKQDGVDRDVYYLSDLDVASMDAFIFYASRYLRWVLAIEAGSVTTTRRGRGRSGLIRWVTPDNWPSTLPGQPA